MATNTEPSRVVTTFLIANIHCPSCVSYITEILSPLPGVFRIDVSVFSHTATVEHGIGSQDSIHRALVAAAYDVRHATSRDSTTGAITTKDYTQDTGSSRRRPRLFGLSKKQRQHLAACDVCRQEQSDVTGFSALFGTSRKRKYSSDQPTTRAEEQDTAARIAVTDGPALIAAEKEYVANLSIQGMTCASCSNSITSGLQTHGFIKSCQINLIANSAKITFSGQEGDVSRIIEAIDDIGFDATLVDVTPSSLVESTANIAKIAIRGMTCASCSTSITAALKRLDGVVSVAVDLIGNSASVTFNDVTTTSTIIEEIEDIGFEAELVDVKAADQTPANKSSVREVTFDLTGMYCSLCPVKVTSHLHETYGASVQIVHPPSMKDAKMTVSYTPSPPNLTIRRLKTAIDSVDPAISAVVYHSPTIHDRSRSVQHREKLRILRHLLLTLVVAIPSFIIGIVLMSLVSSDNPTRLWFEEPIWAGNAMRIDWALFILTTPAMFYGANIFHSRALHEIWAMWRPRSKVPILRRFYRFGSMNLLISAGTSVAYFSSLAILIMEATETRTDDTSSRRSTTYFDSVTFLTLFILCGKYLQAYSKSKTGNTVAMLGQLRPVEASLIVPGTEEESKTSTITVPVDLLEVGDIVSIPHGASPPMDGTIEQNGVFFFDESSLTGESRPVPKSRGDPVLTGTVNTSDPVRITVQELGGTSMLDQIIAVVQDGQAKRAPIERVADILTGYFTPIVTLIAIGTWAIWLALGYSGALSRSWLDVHSGGWAFWSIEFAIAVFVVACPCGLGLAAPTALFVGGGLAAKKGMLVQGGGEAFQEASRLDTIVFDKTGTLTEGLMRVTEMKFFENEMLSEDEVLAVSASIESASTHPVAKAIANYCLEEGKNEVQSEISDVKEVSGKGMFARMKFDSKKGTMTREYEVAIGNIRILEQLGSSATVNASAYETELLRLQNMGWSTSIVAAREIETTDGRPIGHVSVVAVFAITDPIRSETLQVLSSIRSMGIEVHMCTGDNETTARVIAAQLDIPESSVRAGVLPQDKAAYIQELQQPMRTGQRKVVAFVGDGTNDTPALTAADVGIALASGSDIAMTSASFILLNSDLTTILELVRLAKRVFLRVKLNFAWAAVYNICLIPVAAGVFFPLHQWRLSPVWASAAMAASSVSVVLSSLALRLPEVKLGARKP